jgi:uncharacterized protein YndB with AHSA1/START domain
MEKTIQLERLVLTRSFPVGPEKVWRAWVDGDALRVWFGQTESPRWLAELDVRVGGRYRLVLREPNGAYYAVRGVYRELEPNRKLVFTWEQQDSPFDGEALVTVELRAIEGGTELKFTLDPVLDPRAPDAWRGDFKRLGRLLQQTD